MANLAIVIEQGAENLSAYAPDLPGCITTGHTLEEVLANMKEAVALHLEGTAGDKEPVPLFTTQVASIEVELPSVTEG